MTVVRFSNNRYEGLTADTKPTNVPAGAIYRDTQLDIIYEYNGSSWDIMIGNTKTETLTGKTINPTSNIMPFLNSFTYSIYQDGGAVKLRNNKTGVIASNANIDTPLWDALTSGDGTVEILPGTYNVHSSFGGWTLPNYSEVYMHPGVKINVTSGYTGGVFVIGNGVSTIQYAKITGGTFDEQGTKSCNWDLLKFVPTSTSGVTSCSFKDIVVFHAKNAIHHVGTGASWINSNYFDNIHAASCKRLITYDHSGTWTQGTSGANKNNYVNCYLHSSWSDDPDPEGGIIGLHGEDEVFVGCGAYDLWNNASAVSMSITATALNTIIIGGFLTYQNFSDLGVDTKIWDRYQGMYSKDVTHLYDTLNMHGASITNAANVTLLDAALNTFTGQLLISRATNDNLFVRRTTNANGDDTRITYQLRDSGSNTTSYVQTAARIVDNTDTSEDGSFDVFVMRAGSLAQRLTFDGIQLGLGATGTRLFQDVSSISGSDKTVTWGNFTGVPVIDTAAQTLASKTLSDMKETWQSKSTTYTMTQTDYGILLTGTGTYTVTLPAVASSSGRVYQFKKTGASGTVTLDGNASETIDGAATRAMSTQWEYIKLFCDGTAWFIIT